MEKSVAKEDAISLRSLNNTCLENLEENELSKSCDILNKICSGLPSRNPNDLKVCAGKMDQTLSEDLWCHTINISTKRRRNKKVNFCDEDNLIHILEDKTNDGNVNTKIETLRDFPQGLTLKRKIKKRYDENNKCDVFSTRGLHMRNLYCQHKIKSYFANCSFSLLPWNSYLKEIESHFGSGVGAVFIFIRLVFMLHVSVLPFNCGMLLVPQILSLIFHNNTTNISSNGSLHSTYQLETSHTPAVFNVKYSSYDEMLVFTLKYSLPTAYIICISFCSLVLLTIICHRYLASIRNFLTEDVMKRGKFSSIVFTGWDHNITRPETAYQRSQRITTMLKELIKRSDQPMKASLRTSHIFFYSTIALSNLIICGLSATAIYFLYFYWPSHGHLSKLMIFLRSGIFAFTFIVLAKIQTYLNLSRVSFEPQHKVNLAIISHACLLFSSLISAIFCFFRQDIIEDGQCWEDVVGEELLSAFFWNFLLWVIIFPMFTLIRSGLNRNKHTHKFRPEFHCCHFIHSTLLFYTIIWLSFYFTPLVPVLGLLLFAFIFYLFKFILLQHPEKTFSPWHVGRSYNSMLLVILLLHGMVMSIHCCIIFTVKSSNVCGPFQAVDYPYEVFLNILMWMGLSLDVIKIVFYVTKPGAIAVVMTLWVGLIYYLRERSIGKHDVIEKLEQHIIMEAKDKGYLLNLMKDRMGSKKQRDRSSTSLEAQNPHYNDGIDSVPIRCDNSGSCSYT